MPKHSETQVRRYKMRINRAKQPTALMALLGLVQSGCTTSGTGHYIDRSHRLAPVILDVDGRPADPRRYTSNTGAIGTINLKSLRFNKTDSDLQVIGTASSLCHQVSVIPQYEKTNVTGVLLLPSKGTDRSFAKGMMYLYGGLLTFVGVAWSAILIPAYARGEAIGYDPEYDEEPPSPLRFNTRYPSSGWHFDRAQPPELSHIGSIVDYQSSRKAKPRLGDSLKRVPCASSPSRIKLTASIQQSSAILTQKRVDLHGMRATLTDKWISEGLEQWKADSKPKWSTWLRKPQLCLSSRVSPARDLTVEAAREALQIIEQEMMLLSAYKGSSYKARRSRSRQIIALRQQKSKILGQIRSIERQRAKMSATANVTGFNKLTADIGPAPLTKSANSVCYDLATLPGLATKVEEFRASQMGVLVDQLASSKAPKIGGRLLDDQEKIIRRLFTTIG